MNMTTLNTPLPEDLMKLKWNGQFKLMQEMIDLRLQKDIPTKLKERLELEKELISRLPENFTYSKEDAIELLKSKISDFKDEEFDELKQKFNLTEDDISEPFEFKKGAIFGEKYEIKYTCLQIQLDNKDAMEMEQKLKEKGIEAANIAADRLNIRINK